MTGDELVSRLSADCEQPRDIIRDILQALAGVVAEGLRNGGRISLPGLGALTATVRSRMGAPQVRVTWWTHPDLHQQLAPLAQGKTGVKTPARPRPRRGSRAAN